MYYEEEDIFYYITLMNENYEMPILPLGSTEGICRGIYKPLAARSAAPKKPKVQLFGSGAILREALRAQELLEQHFGVGSNVYSVTSYKALYYDGRDATAGTACIPRSRRGGPMSRRCCEGAAGPVVAALDYVSAVGLSIAPWVWSGLHGAGHRRFRPQRGPPRNCGASSRSTPRTSPWPPWPHWRKRASFPRNSSPSAIQNAGP